MDKPTISINPYAMAITMTGLTSLVLINKGGGSYFFEIGSNLAFLLGFFGIIGIIFILTNYSIKKNENNTQ